HLQGARTGSGLEGGRTHPRPRDAGIILSFARSHGAVPFRSGKLRRGRETLPARADAGGRAIGTGISRKPPPLVPRKAGGLIGGDQFDGETGLEFKTVLRRQWPRS